MSGPWLGQQEALYSGLRWHLKVPSHGYVEQFNAPGSIMFPGQARVNVGGAGSEAKVEIEGHVGAWATDVELASGLTPKLYGFDFARATEVWDDANSLRKIMPQLQPGRRLDSGEFLPGERGVMKDLVLSTLYMGGEACLSYHMFNPYSTQPAGGVSGRDVSDYFSFNHSPGFSSGLKGTDLAAASCGDARTYVQVRCQYLAAFLDEVLSNPGISTASNIYVRLFHEPNAGFFWWGQPPGVPASDAAFMGNYHALWNFAVNEIKTGIAQSRRHRVKFVFSINREDSLALLKSSLDAYLPAMPDPAAQTFLNNIDLLGLDYYQDSQLGGTDTLSAQYAELVTRATAHNKAHALTEVGIRTGYSGKLYGPYGGADPWSPPSDRSFFGGSVRAVALAHQPLWVMFWANRMGNSVLSNYAPTTTNSAMPNHSGLYYGDAEPNGTCVDVFADPDSELFTPLSPKLPFSLLTFLAGDATGAAQSLQIPGGFDALQYVPGAVDRTACQVVQPLTPTAAGLHMTDAVDDFDAMLSGAAFDTL